jgi:ligand-binding sensor domain-containing protein
MQDSKGYIWTSGNSGVCRFNGYEFKSFTMSNGLQDNSVFNMYEDSKKRIWFTSLVNRLCYYFNDSIYPIDCNDSLHALLNYNLVTSIFVDANDTIWLGTKNNYYIKIKPAWDKKSICKVEVVSGKYIIQIDNGIIFGGKTPILTDIHLYKKGVLISKIETKIVNESRRVPRFYALKLKNGTFIACIGPECLHFDQKKILNKTIEKDQVISILEAKNGSVLCSTYKGLTHYSSSDFKNKHEVPQLSSKIVTGMYIDKENSLWISTEGYGLYSAFFRNFRYYSVQNGLPDTKINSTGVNEQNLFLGHVNGLITIIGPDSLATIHPHYKNELNENPRAVSICSYKKQLYISSDLNISRLQKNELELLPKLVNQSVRKLIIRKDGTIWGTDYYRLINIGTFENPKMEKFSIDSTKIIQELEDRHGTIWVLTIKGVYTFDYTSSAVYKVNKIFDIRCSDIAEDLNGNIWIATNGNGIIVKEKNETKHITIKEGLSSDVCRTILIDSNVVWVGTNKGLCKITTDKELSLTIENIYTKNGLITDEVNDLYKRDREIWVIHNDAISIFNPNQLKNNSTLPPIYLTSVVINGENYKDTIASSLNYNQNFLSFNFVGLSYKDAGNALYKYKLEGLDTNWHYTGYTQINYQTVPPGEYRFIVYASNNDGYWSSVPATFQFRILHPWWQTWTFIIAAIVLVFGLFFYIVRLRLNKIRKREEEKLKLKQRISETELQALRAQMNPHFIFNSINSVQYFMTENDAKSSQKYLAKFARLIRYVVDNSKPTVVPLKIELEALQLYLELESLRFEDRFEYAIHVDSLIDLDQYQIPSMLIQPYVENSIWHGLMHKEGKGRIDVNLVLVDHVIKCTVVDNGIGRKKSQEIKNKNRNGTKRSLGLTITENRLDIINQITNLNLSVAISDITDKNGNIAGTKVELTIPIN